MDNLNFSTKKFPSAVSLILKTIDFHRLSIETKDRA